MQVRKSVTMTLVPRVMLSFCSLAFDGWLVLRLRALVTSFWRGLQYVDMFDYGAVRSS